MKRSIDLKNRLQQIHEDLENRKTLKLQEIDQFRAQLERYNNDLRTIQSESSLLDRLMEESNSTIIDSTNNRTLFFTVETRTIQNLLDIIENKVSLRLGVNEEKKPSDRSKLDIEFDFESEKRSHLV